MIVVIHEDILSNFRERKRKAIERAIGAKVPDGVARDIERYGLDRVLEWLEVRDMSKDEVRRRVNSHLCDEDLYELDEVRDGVREALEEISRKHDVVYLGRGDGIIRFIRAHELPDGDVYTSVESVLDNFKKKKLIFVGIPVADMNVKSIGVGTRDDQRYTIVIDDISELPRCVEEIR